MPEEQRVPLGLLFESVRGTTSQRAAQFAVCGGQIAYVAGSGVVVAKIQGKTVEKQRLFVANGTEIALSVYGYPKSIEIPDEELKRDLFGFPVGHTHYYRGTSAENELLLTSLLELKDGSSHPAISKLKDKVRAPTCVAISPNGRVLAVGETGYQPRVLLFSLAPDSASQPFAVIREHTFGVEHVEFAPNLRYLCSLGTVNDGFLHVWKYSATTVTHHAANKCTNTVNDVLWHANATEFGEIVTLGLRSIRIWLLDTREPNLPSKVAALRGRNIILGRFLESNFQAAIPFGEDEILIQELTNYYLLSLKGETQIQQIVLDSAKVSGVVVDTSENAIWVLDHDFMLQTLSLQELTLVSEAEAEPNNPISPSKSNGSKVCFQETAILKARACGTSHFVYLTNTGEILLHERNTRQNFTLVSSLVSSVSGGKRTSSGELLLFSKHGQVVALTALDDVIPIINHELPQAESVQNELTAVEKSETTLFLGDKYGLLTIADISGAEPKTELVIKAHASSINDIVFFEVDNIPLLCSISRDRMIQVYLKSDTWDVLCTLPLHTANLLSVKFKRNVKLFDEKTAEALCVDRFMLLESNKIAVFGNDRSLRLYDLDSGKQSACVWGHKDLVIGIFESNGQILSLGSDGCLFRWNILHEGDSEKHQIPTKLEPKSSISEIDDSPLLAKVTRKFLPTAQMARLTISPKRPASTEGVVLLEPESPTPRLTSATLKRIEARKKAQNGAISAPKTASTQEKYPTKSPLRSKSVSPPKGQSSTAPTPFNRGLTPGRQTPLLRSLHVAAQTQNVFSPRRGLAPSLPPPSSASSDAKEKTFAYLTIIKSFIGKDLLEDEDKGKLRSELESLLALLGGPDDHEAMLEKYSDSLVSLVQKKLSGM
ncbi:hypothetical protein HF325_003576 [Metschnikowia pulcherrima]|uniref:Mitogen-activated protein kinase-binding protein 1 n=1 Tax=Metschnikowia pulcherrima TaxID=27326 RepID=A0A8H7GTZ0_9ASCO|nr:hypothetical protein HF325_003576 [Metschnikowia pulcherrima]